MNISAEAKPVFSDAVLLDRAVTRNARLIVALRHVTHTIHERGGHTGNWMTCGQVMCQRVRAVIDATEVAIHDLS